MPRWLFVSPIIVAALLALSVPLATLPRSEAVTAPVNPPPGYWRTADNSILEGGGECGGQAEFGVIWPI